MGNRMHGHGKSAATKIRGLLKGNSALHGKCSTNTGLQKLFVEHNPNSAKKYFALTKGAK